MDADAQRIRDAIADELKRFIADELLDEPLDDDPLAVGAVDSLGIEQLVHYIEQEYGVRLADEEMVRENFASVPTLAAFVDGKRRGLAR